MKFVEWLNSNSDFSMWLVEIADLKSASTGHISLVPTSKPAFNEVLAQQECDRYIDRTWTFRPNKPVYDYPEEDRSFRTPSPKKWQENNPRPEPEEYESDTQYEHAVETWESDLSDVEYEYEHAVVVWEEEMAKRREENEKQEKIEREEAVGECIAEKKEEFDNDNDNWNGYDYNFSHNGDNFVVEIRKINLFKEIKYFNKQAPEVKQSIQPLVKNVFHISFAGPNKHKTTNKNTGMTAIYSQLLLAIKKLFETEDVQGLTFTAYEQKMSLVYRRFFKQFLADKFMVISPELFLRKDIAKQIMQLLPHTGARQEIANKIVQGKQSYYSDLQSVEQEVAKNRQKTSLLKSMLGKIVKFYDVRTYKFSPAVVVNYKISRGEFLVDLLTPTPDNLHLQLLDSRNADYLSVLKPQNAQPFIQLIHHKTQTQDEWHKDFLQPLGYNGSLYTGQFLSDLE